MTEAEVKNEENQKIIAELAQSYKRFAETSDGKIILADLEVQCGQNKANSLPDFNTNKTFFHEGMRNVYLYIMQKVKREERD
jgi:S-ribosylhomocysteine lyase LuxS involved in autoinducer biosynthesis